MKLLVNIACPLAVVWVVFVFGSVGWSTCPQTGPWSALCPDPALNTICEDIKGEMSCKANKGQYRETDYFTCVSTGILQQCVDSTMEVKCYTEYQCKWYPDEGKCKKDDTTGAPKNKVQKKSIPCS